MLYPTCAVYSPMGDNGRLGLWKGLELPYNDAVGIAVPNGKEIPNAGGNIGLAAILSFSSSAS